MRKQKTRSFVSQVFVGEVTRQRAESKTTKVKKSFIIFLHLLTLTLPNYKPTEEGHLLYE